MAISQQHVSADEIILVDNGSTDGSPSMVRREFPAVTIFETEKNLGGAGGFAWGLELAIAHGHDAAWLMDDDAEPLEDSLEPLVEALESASERPGFVASLVVNEQGGLNSGHVPDVSVDAKRQLKAQELGGIAVDSASFVGVLVDLQRAREMALPYADFFIWFDDLEYTRRLAHRSFGISIPASKILHPQKQNQTDMGARLFYYIRNSLWLSRLDERPRSLLRNPVTVMLGMIRLSGIQLLKARDKRECLMASFHGLYQGLGMTPKKIIPGQLISGSGTAT